MSRPRYSRAAWCRAISAPLGILLVSGAVSGCGASEEAAAQEAASTFYETVGAGDGATACELLAAVTRSELEDSSAKPCDVAVLEEVNPKVGGDRTVQVFGSMAQVTFDGDTVFLTRSSRKWRVLAAACTPQRDAPHDCQVKGA